MAVKDIRQVRAVIARGRRWDLIFAVCGVLALMLGVLTFVTLFMENGGRRSASAEHRFLHVVSIAQGGECRHPVRLGGSTLVMVVTASVAVPLGVAAGIYLEEYAGKHWINDVIEINITNLAGVPSIVYGLLALGLFVYAFGLGQSILSAGLTLALLILPVVIVATREAIRSIPQGSARRPTRSAPRNGRW